MTFKKSVCSAVVVWSVLNLSVRCIGLYVVRFPGSLLIFFLVLIAIIESGVLNLLLITCCCLFFFLSFCQYLLYIFGSSNIRCIYFYIFLVNWPFLSLYNGILLFHVTLLVLKFLSSYIHMASPALFQFSFICNKFFIFHFQLMCVLRSSVNLL